MSIDAAAIAKLCKLSHLEFSPEEGAAMAEKLGNILDFVSQLQEVNTEGVAPMLSAVGAAATPEREDAVTEVDKRDAYLAVAPASEMGFYVVPRVVE